MVEEERKETLNEVNDKKELPTHRRTPEALHDFGPKAVYSGIKRVPCMRSSLMYGIVGGLGVGMLRYYWRANVMVSCNYAVGMFAISSVLSWHLCTYQHDDNIKRARVFVEAVRSNRGAAIGDSNHTTSATQDRLLSMPNASGLLRAHYAKSLSTKASSTSEAAATQALKAKRPLSPHLQIYEPQLTWVMSIAHRFTGAGLAAGVYAGGIWYAVAPFASTAVVSSVAAIPGVLLFSGKFLLSASYSYHFWNGIRHLLWDIRYGLSLKSVYATGYAVSGATLLSSLWLALL